MADVAVPVVKPFASQGRAMMTKCVFCCNDLVQRHHPYLLPCLHSSCKNCLPLSQPMVQCGNCDLPFNPSEAVPHLVLLEKLSEEQPEEDDNTQEKAHGCTSCSDDETATGYCEECAEWLCKDCRSAHQRVKVTKDHKIMSTEEAAAALKDAAKNKYQYCSAHPKEQLKSYCTRCEILTCKDCRKAGDHIGHENLDLSAAWDQHKPQLRILQERIVEKQSFLRNYISVIDKCSKENSESEVRCVGELKQFALVVITLITSRIKSIMSDLMTKCEQKRAYLDHRKSEFTGLTKRLLDCHAVVEELLSNGSELALAHSKKLIEKHMAQLIDHNVSVPRHTDGVNMEFSYDPGIIELLKTSGVLRDLSTIRPSPSVTGAHRQQHMNGAARHGVPPPGYPSTMRREMNGGSGVPQPIVVERKMSAGSGVPGPSPIASPAIPVSDLVNSSTAAMGGQRVTPSASPSIEASAVGKEAVRMDQTTPTKHPDSMPVSRLVTSAGASAQHSVGSVAGSHPEDNSDDWCAVCHDGGELLCCGSCPKVYHLHCHVPNLVSTPGEDWKCTLCTSIDEDASLANSVGKEISGSKRKIPVGLSGRQLGICEKILLQLFCHNSSTPFQTPVGRTVPNYFKIITRPMDLSTVKQKLSPTHFNHYDSAGSFIADIKLIFSNCYTFNAKESQLSQTAKALEEFFVQMVSKELPECIGDLKETKAPTDNGNSATAERTAIIPTTPTTTTTQFEQDEVIKRLKLTAAPGAVTPTTPASG